MQRKGDSQPRIRVEVKKSHQPKVVVKLKTPPFSLAGRRVKVKVVLQNKTDSIYPPEDNTFLLLDIYTIKIGVSRVIIPPL